MNPQPIRLYRPDTPDAFEAFVTAWCADCRHDAFENGTAAGATGADQRCNLLTRAQAHGTDHPQYPTAWRYNDYGFPVCMQFEPLNAPPALSVAVRDDRTPDLFGGGA